VNFTLKQEQYEALIALARQGVQGSDVQVMALDAFLRSIEKANGVTRDFLWVQWQELNQPLPSSNTVKFPDTWPPHLRKSIELVTRRIARVDVEAVLEANANDPTSVLVTRDPNARLGWTTLDDFFRV
jgi:hypothetical protein